jgi:hypothetical protein
MKNVLFAAALMAALIPIAAAQDSRLPEASLDREVNLQVPARTAVSRNTPRQSLMPPSYCKPCLFYAGDFDSSASDANGLANEFDIVVSTGAAVYTPFRVPRGKTWTVTGLFTNNNIFPDIPVLDPPMIPYEVRKGIPKNGGDGGTLVCHGKKLGTLTLSQIDQELYIYATQVRNIKGCRLGAGKYWTTVIPYCTNSHDSTCEASYRAFLMNDDGAMSHSFGPLEPANNSFFNSAYFGANWDPSSKWQTSSRFSVGVEGRATRR